LIHDPDYWCYLGEIVDQTTLHHLELELVDIDNKKIPLHFNTPGLGSELAPAQVKNGYTVAVPYAKRHVFLYGGSGIRHEDPSNLKVYNFLPLGSDPSFIEFSG
jgi:hypothetical protein